MREKFLKKSIASVKKKYPYYTEEKLEEIEYGLDAIYLNIPKTIIIFGLAIILGIFKDMILLLTFYGILRTFAFGMHASKSWHCLVISTVMFIGGGLVCKYISIPYYVKIIISIISFPILQYFITFSVIVSNSDILFIRITCNPFESFSYPLIGAG